MSIIWFIYDNFSSFFIRFFCTIILAVRKPLRYDTVQTKTRCQCWMCFTWISAAMLCCPSLWTEKDPTFDKYAFICVPNWNHMAAYSVTLGNFCRIGNFVIFLNDDGLSRDQTETSPDYFLNRDHSILNFLNFSYKIFGKTFSRWVWSLCRFLKFIRERNFAKA